MPLAYRLPPAFSLCPSCLVVNVGRLFRPPAYGLSPPASVGAQRDTESTRRERFEKKLMGRRSPRGLGLFSISNTKRVPQPCGCGGPRDDLELAHARLFVPGTSPSSWAPRAGSAPQAASLTSDWLRPPTKVFFDEELDPNPRLKKPCQRSPGVGFRNLTRQENGPEPVATRTFGPRRSAVPSAQPAILANQLGRIIAHGVAWFLVRKPGQCWNLWSVIGGQFLGLSPVDSSPTTSHERLNLLAGNAD